MMGGAALPHQNKQKNPNHIHNSIKSGTFHSLKIHIQVLSDKLNIICQLCPYCIFCYNFKINFGIETPVHSQDYYSLVDNHPLVTNHIL